jgi:arthrofactin-type cyclic lipopeptide synthetase C
MSSSSGEHFDSSRELQMTTALEVLASVRSRGAHLWVAEGSLRFEAPKGALSSADLDSLRRFKGEIVALLTIADSTRRPSLTPCSVEEVGLLTPIQREWTAFINGRPPATKYNAFAIHLLGYLHPDVLTSALTDLVARHDILRARFVQTSEGVRVVTQPRAPQHPELIDVLQTADEARSQFLDEPLANLASTRISLFDAPLFNAQCYRLSSEEHVLAVAVDRTLSDCYSNEIIATELMRAFKSSGQQDALPLTRPQVQYADYAAWLERDRRDWFESHYSHWRNILCAPTLRHEDPIPSHREELIIDAFIPVFIDQRLTQRLLEAARVQHSFPALLVLTACIAAFCRCTGRSNLVVVTADSGRHSPPLGEMIGWLVNYLYLRVEIMVGETMSQLLRRVSEQFERARHNCDFNRVPSLFGHLRPDLYFSWVAGQTHAPSLSDGDITSPGLQTRPYPIRAAKIQPCEGFTFNFGDNVTGRLAYDSSVSSELHMRELKIAFDASLHALVAQHENAVADR